jgi:hypothetical protein
MRAGNLPADIEFALTEINLTAAIPPVSLIS